MQPRGLQAAGQEATQLQNFVINEGNGGRLKMLRRITELVDRDVAANPKPISMIGVVIPFIPFTIYRRES